MTVEKLKLILWIVSACAMFDILINDRQYKKSPYLPAVTCLATISLVFTSLLTIFTYGKEGFLVIFATTVFFAVTGYTLSLAYSASFHKPVYTFVPVTFVAGTAVFVVEPFLRALQ